MIENWVEPGLEIHVGSPSPQRIQELQAPSETREVVHRYNRNVAAEDYPECADGHSNGAWNLTITESRAIDVSDLATAKGAVVIEAAPEGCEARLVRGRTIVPRETN